MTIQGDCGFQSDAFQNNAFQICVDVPVVIEARRWPGPSYIIYSDNFYFTKKWQLRKEDEEIIIL